MFCPKCGTEVNEGIFCPKCGEKVTDESTLTNDTQSSTESMDQNPYVQPGAVSMNNAPIPPQNVKPKSKISPAIIGIAVAILAVLTVVIVLVKNHKTTVDLDKYISVEYEGYDTLGKAKVVFDWKAFDQDYSGKIKIDRAALKKLARQELGDDLGGYLEAELSTSYVSQMAEDSATEIIREFVDGEWELDEHDGLSNGDNITFKWSIDEDYMAEMMSILKCKLDYDEEQTFVVSGLEEVGTFDPFDDLKIEYSGIGPDGRASLDYDSGKYDYYINYSLDKNSGLSNGDTITVSVKVSGSEESFINNYGVLPSPMEKTYTVDGLMEYINTAEDIPDDLMASMQSQAEDVIKSVAAKNWSEEAEIKALTYMGNYYLTRKGDSGDFNRCVIVYKITATLNMVDADTEKKIAQDQDIYYYVTFYNLMKEEDGTGAVDIARYDTSYNSFRVETDVVRDNGWWTTYYNFSFYGFEDLSQLYNEVVTKNLERYAHEDNVVE